MNRMKVQETPRTEARMASLLYIWNISFKSISDEKKIRNDESYESSGNSED